MHVSSLRSERSLDLLGGGVGRHAEDLVQILVFQRLPEFRVSLFRQLISRGSEAGHAAQHRAAHVAGGRKGHKQVTDESSELVKTSSMRLEPIPFIS